MSDIYAPIIKLGEVNKGPEQSKDFIFTISQKEMEEQMQDFEFLNPVVFQGVVNFKENIYNLAGEITTQLRLKCGRCVEDVVYDVKQSVEENYTLKDITDEDIIKLDKDVLDLTELVNESIYLSVPYKVLCKESCLGLCPQCGSNLNISKCQCEGESIDPRMAILKDLFKE